MFCLLLRVVDRGELVVQVGTEAVEGIIRISGRPPPTLGSPLVRAFLTACQVLAQANAWAIPGCRRSNSVRATASVSKSAQAAEQDRQRSDG
jgi:hypothetical protein